MEIFNLKNEILYDRSKSNTIRIVKYISNNEERFAELVNLFFDNDSTITQRASWIISYVIEAHPTLIINYYEEFFNYLSKDVHNAVKRNILRSLQFAEIPVEWEGKIIDVCFKIIENKKEAIAIRAFAISVAYNICRKYPEILLELKALLKDQIEFEKPAFVSRAKKILN